MDIDLIITLITTVGFPIVSTVALGIFINQAIKHQREDMQRREEALIQQITTLTNLVIGLTQNKEVK